MRFFLIVLFFKLSSYSAVAQDCMAVMASRGNQLFLNIENPLTIIISHNIKSPEIETNNGKLIKRNDNMYTIVPEKLGRCNIIVKDGNKVVFVSPFNVMPIPEPDFYTDNSIAGGSITSQRFNEATSLVGRINNFEWNIKPAVKSFSITRISKTGTYSHTNNGSHFTEETKLLISKAEKGDIYLFDMIEFSLFSEMSKPLKNLVFRII